MSFSRALGNERRRHVLRGALTTTVIRVAASASSYLLIVTLARVMGAAEFGRFTFALAAMYVLAIPAGLGLQNACVRFLAEYARDERWDEARSMIRFSTLVTLTGGVLLGLLTLAASRSFAAHLPSGAAPAMAAAAVGIPLFALSSLGAQIARTFGWVAVAYVPSQLVQPWIVVASLAIVVVAGVELTSMLAVAISVAAFGIAALGQGAVLAARLAARPATARAPVQARTWLRVSLPLLLIDAFTLVLAQTDVLMVGALATVTDVAHYNAAVRVGMLVTFVFTAIRTLAGPSMAQLSGASDKAALQELLSGLALWIVVPTLAVGGVVVAAGPQLLDLFGPGFAAGYSALVVLSAGHVVVACLGPVSLALNMTGHQNVTARVYGAALAVNIGLNAVLIPRFGIEGAAAATSLTAVAAAAVLSVAVRARLGVAASVLSARIGPLTRDERGPGEPRTDERDPG